MEWKFPMPMMICCYQCGKGFDVMIPDVDAHEYPCPACGKVEVLDFGALEKKVQAYNEKLGRKIRGEL